jgi:two-component system chemotaxis sensor kinase CheA
MDELQVAFVQESGEQLQALEDILLLLEQQPDDNEAINTLFRAAHTIKGAAGVVECDFIVGFTHVMENLLDEIRAGKVAITSDLIARLLQCKDHVQALVDLFATGADEVDDALAARGEFLTAHLRAFLPNPFPTPLPTGEPVKTSAPSEEAAEGHDCWHISIRFGENVLRSGMEPLAILRYLGTLGEFVHLTTLFDHLPPAATMDPESCYLGFEIDFRSRADRASIERVFDFVRDECVLRILPPTARVAEFIQLIQELPEDTMRLGEILVKTGAITEADLMEGLNLQIANQEETPAPIGEILVEQQMLHKEVVEAAVSKQQQVNDKKAQDAKLIRVQADKLDQLIDLVGELVIAGAAGALTARRSRQTAMVEAYSLISRLVEEIRNSALQLRMVQIGETFNRFHRVVRDGSRDLGKDIDLVISGGETELDKSVVEKIGDPLMHLVRNAMDHGIETADKRIAQGKPAKGSVHFNAFHDSGSIFIEVSDDGAGLNHTRILDKAVERGLVPAGSTLTDAEIGALIFEPGFSTAEQITNISGRGVGMDVVKRNIEALRGNVEVASRAGSGTTFRIRLPLTLAIIDGFLVGVGKSSYIVPLDYVVECMELDRSDTENRDYLNLRGEVLPFLRLREMFATTGAPGKRQNVVIVQSAGKKVGLVVDQLMGEFQTVIKPLSKLFQHLHGISGSTILGTGEVALILDLPALIARVTHPGA